MKVNVKLRKCCVTEKFVVGRVPASRSACQLDMEIFRGCYYDLYIWLNAGNVFANLLFDWMNGVQKEQLQRNIFRIKYESIIAIEMSVKITWLIQLTNLRLPWTLILRNSVFQNTVE